MQKRLWVCDLFVLGSICDAIFLASVAFSRSSDPGASSLRQHICACVCGVYPCWWVRCWVILPVPFCQDVSAPSLLLLFIPPALRPPSLFLLGVAALAGPELPDLNSSQGVFLFTGAKLPLCSSDFPHKGLVNVVSCTHYETKLASSCLLGSFSVASNSFYGKQQNLRCIFSLDVTSVLCRISQRMKDSFCYLALWCLATQRVLFTQSFEISASIGNPIEYNGREWNLVWNLRDHANIFQCAVNPLNACHYLILTMLAKISWRSW